MASTGPPIARPLVSFERSQDARLSMPLDSRLKLGTALAILTGFPLGATQGSLVAGLRFRAENAHRLPKTQTGWYLYHKSKNYHKAKGGLREGIKMVSRMVVWTAVFVCMEEGIDRARYMAAVVRRGDDADNYVSNDFISTSLAGIGTAGAFSAWNKFPLPTATRVAKLGLKVGLAYGLAQDLLSIVRGRRLGYVEFFKRHILGTREQDETVTSSVAG